MFDLSQDNDVEEEKDNIGGLQQLETNVYEFEVVMAYLSEAASGAVAMNFELKTDSGATHRETIYITSGTAKGGKTYYIHKTTGKKHNLPGYTQVYNIVAITLGQELRDAVKESEKKTLKLYDFKVGSEVDKEIDHVFVKMIGKRVKLGIKKIVENKTKKNETTGKYDPINEEREKREISVAFYPESNLTVSETKDKIEVAEFHDKWLAKWKGKEVNKFKEVKVDPSAATEKKDEGAFPGFG